jgi:hypothetical protein
MEWLNHGRSYHIGVSIDMQAVLKMVFSGICVPFATEGAEEIS